MRSAIICAAFICIFSIILLTQPMGGQAVITTNTESGENECKELNNYSCYTGKNEGNYCSSKDKTKTIDRWYYDRGVCRKFNYKGCNGNRNRFCTKETCEKRCGKD